MSDTLYAELKEQGLILSKQVEIGFPPIRSPKSTLIGQLVSYVLPQKNFENQPYQLIVLPILNNCFVVARCNTLLCYKFQIESEKQSAKPVISKPHVYNLRIKIQKIHICDNKYLNDRGEIPIILEAKTGLGLFYVDLKENRIIQKNFLMFDKIISLRCICEKELVFLKFSGSTYFIYHLIIEGGVLKEKRRTPADLQISQGQKIRQVNILGNIDEEQQSTICLFYSLQVRNSPNSEILKVKQYIRDLEGQILPKNIFNVINTHSSAVLAENYEIVNYENYFCILMKHEILILKKKFDKYLFIDNIMQKISGNTLKLHPKGIVTSHSGNSMEINIILFNDPKCNSKLLDNIQIPIELSEGFLMTWPFTNEKETTLMFVFKKDRKLVFCNLRKTDPYEKMIMVVSNTPKDKISVVQQIAVNLGISKKDFYLNQWSHSKRQLPEIYQFLIPCCDIKSIKKQLRMTMRRKKIQVSELLKILEKIGKIIKNQLKTNLSQTLLKQYIKNDFLLRKIKLKEASKRMDHREMQKVYNSSLIDMFVQIVKNQLYPSQKQLDPLHAMVEAPPKQQANLKHVFQQFKMMILQNYKRFLINFIAEFNASQIVKVIDEYYFLLPTYKYKPNLIIHEPDYMTEVELNQMILTAEKTQQKWFSEMTSIQFAREMSKQRIQKELHDYYPNSKIHEAINTLITSEYGVKEKLHRHGLISCTMSEYKDKLNEIQDIKLYLKVCEHVNQYNLTENLDKDLSAEIVEIFKKKNKLSGEAYQKVKLYTSLHRFMLKNNFFEKKVMTVEQLIDLTAEDLVALFFLQNRQRKEFIFKDFRDLFVNLYKRPNQFNAVINRFVNSENCSRIQLQIFINEIKNKGENFQKQNQDLIELMIDGFCRKLEVREDSDTERFLDIMEEIELSKKLAMKINKINQVRECSEIFNIFNCQKESYFNILHYQEDNQIFKLLLNTFFNQGMKKDFVRLQNQEFSLDYCKNMLPVLLYLQEQVYYEVTSKQLLLTYGEVLIEWKQFDVIKEIIYEQDNLQKLEIDRDEFLYDLITKTLIGIYDDEEIIYDAETKEHIKSILDIYEGDHEIKIQEYAKMEIVEIFQAWETKLHTKQIQFAISQWAEGNKKDFIIDLINQYIDSLNFSIFEQIYKCFEVGSGRPVEEVDICNQQFVEFSLAYAQKLLEHKMYDEIVKILAFTKTMPEALKPSYALVSETFLKCLSKKYPDEGSIEAAKQAIEYFSQNFNQDQCIQRVFESNLSSAQFEYKSVERETSIPVKENFCFGKKHSVNIQIDFLWEIATAVYQERDKKLQILYYSYYFLIQIFRNPDSGFSKNHKISYNFEILVDTLFKLQAKIDEHNQLWGINIYAFFKKLLKGLYLEGLTRIRQFNPDLFKAFHNDETQLEAIKARLRFDKENNSELLKCISKIQVYSFPHKSGKKTEKQLRFEKFRETKEPQTNQHEVVPIENEPEQTQNDHGVTINLRKFKERKMEISRASNTSGVFISEKDILERIYELQIEEKQTKRKIHKPKNGASFFLTGLLSSASRQSTLNNIKAHIESEEWDKLRNFSIEDILHVVETIYHEHRFDFHQIVSILRELRVVEEKKLEILICSKLYLSEFFNLTSSELKKLFPLSYIVSPCQQNPEQFKQQLYMVMRPSFGSVISDKDNNFVRNMANYIGNVLSQNAYVARFYIDMIILMGNKRLEAETIIRLTIIMHTLREYPHDVRVYLTNILEAFRENTQMLDIIKQELLICLQDLKEDEVEKYINEY